ncbi:hypothetical protein L1887_58365 [Cichorium endivia]|nr:hypothetical protein L1887_58365 [Cichorium endivia]
MMKMQMDSLAASQLPTAVHAVKQTHDGPLSVLGLGEDDGAVRIEDLVVHLVALARQAVHELPVGLGAARLGHGLSHLEAVEVAQALFLLRLVAHADPRVGDDDVRITYRLGWVVGPVDLAKRNGRRARLAECREAVLHRAPHELVALVRGALGRGHREVDAQTRIGHEHVVQDVVAVAHPSHLEAREASEVAGRCRRRVYLEHRLQICEDLRGVVARRERIDHRHRRVLCQQLHLVVTRHTRHDAIHHRADHLGCIVQALVHAELDVRRRQEECRATERCDTRLGRNTSTRAALAEDDGHRLVLQALRNGRLACAELLARRRRKRKRGASERLLELDRRLEHRADLGRRELGQCQEMRRRACRLGCRRRGESANCRAAGECGARNGFHNLSSGHAGGCNEPNAHFTLLAMKLLLIASDSLPCARTPARTVALLSGEGFMDRRRVSVHEASSAPEILGPEHESPKASLAHLPSLKDCFRRERDQCGIGTNAVLYGEW